MPYIKHEDRVAIGLDEIYKLAEKIEKHGAPGREGRLNYVITRLLIHLYGANDLSGELRGSLSYAKVNEALGALEAIKQEFYRRAAGPYEDKKIAENGDVY